MIAGNDRPTTGAVISAVFLATLIGAFIRGIHVFAADFPLNDGGLFVAMTRDLVGNAFAIPAFSSYNGTEIPFLYPPLGFYVAGLISATGMDIFSIFRFVPVAVSILTVPAVYLLASATLPSRFAALIATIAYAVVPRSFEWLIAGGGLTRSLGILFAILVLWAAVRLERRPDRGRCLTLGILEGLAVLSHPGAVVVTGLWLLAIVATSRDRIRTLRWFSYAAIITLAVIGPWLLVVLSTHGLGGVVGASQTGLDPAASLAFTLGFDLTNETYVTLVGALSLLGIALLARAGDWRWALLVLVAALEPRTGSAYVMPVVAATAAVAITAMVLPAFSSKVPRPGMVWPDATIGTAPRVLLAAFLVIGVTSAVDARNGHLTPLFALGPDTRAAMAEVANVTPAEAEVIVVGGTGWWVDATSEWFPILAGRRNVATVQGSEWLGRETWKLAVDRHVELQACAFADVECFEIWRQTHGSNAGFVFMPRDVPGFSPVVEECCPGLRDGLPRAGYPVVFDLPGGTLLRIPD